MPDRSDRKASSLYVHVPFCARKCDYCAFYSEASEGEKVQRYVDALGRELELVAEDVRPRTVFFGGGTPSLLNLKQWRQVFGVMEGLGLLGAVEWTIECNPATVSLDKALLWRSYGVNRISMGVQSLDERLLERLGRVHSRGMVFRSFEVLRRAGFGNINLDLMFGIPGQSLGMWRETLREAIGLGSEHLSCYEVIYEEDTVLYEQLRSGRFAIDEDLACAQYEELIAFSGESGLEQYEIANFARDARGSGGEWPSFACAHNINYWRGGWYYGLGPSAAGYVRGVRTKNCSNTAIYCERLEGGGGASESEEALSSLERAGETAAFGLRMTAGWRFEEFEEVTGHDLRRGWEGEMLELEGKGWGRVEGTGFRLTPVGLRFADAAAELFLR